MSNQVTQDVRERLLDRAVDAVRARLAVAPGTDRDSMSVLSDRAMRAVTEAVTRGGYVHTQIALLAGCSGLQVINLITDWSAQGVALGIERNAAANYRALVREAARDHALQRVGAEGYGAKSRIAREIGVTRPVVDEWIEQAKVEQERSYE